MAKMMTYKHSVLTVCGYALLLASGAGMPLAVAGPDDENKRLFKRDYSAIAR